MTYCDAIMTTALQKWQRRPRPPSLGNPRLLRLLRQRFYLLCEAVLLSRGLVLVDDAARRGAVDGRGIGVQRGRGLGGVAAAKGDLDLLDRGAKRRAQADILGALVDGLAGALCGLLGVGHGLGLDP